MGGLFAQAVALHQQALGAVAALAFVQGGPGLAQCLVQLLQAFVLGVQAVEDGAVQLRADAARGRAVQAVGLQAEQDRLRVACGFRQPLCELAVVAQVGAGLGDAALGDPAQLFQALCGVAGLGGGWNNRVPSADRSPVG